MNFSEVFKLSGLLCKFSPDGKYLVSARGARGKAARGSAGAGLSRGPRGDSRGRRPAAGDPGHVTRRGHPGQGARAGCPSRGPGGRGLGRCQPPHSPVCTCQRWVMAVLSPSEDAGHVSSLLLLWHKKGRVWLCWL